ncbi:hypothetical protein [Pragia fontium]|uniref:Uncharacterized protein n=2 Tax=Pragia fontium TaxID=82985 RepID=A0AAJ4WCW3_9GAMM|nr:hypothetical protein [Pragia fontium]AKJ43442.1 hypothetical protein QQ39_16410 [Pragia fontium]SFD28777.1 hypothetical protein SAMN02745723_11222 [Pragia fontium DSM 5563 = ATCC 49100]SUB83911.1 Uncharacterised protein [Pragia fontium]VEJ56814.1 Uncharacterised protein [Pragia fontium]
MSIPKNTILYIILIKIVYSFLAVFVFSQFSSLGDTDDYLNGHYLHRSDFSSTAYLMSVIGSSLGSLGSFLFSIILSIIGILYMLEKANLQHRTLPLVLLLIALPSFGVWTSIFSKEIFVLFSFCICVGGLIDQLNDKRKFFSIFQIFALLLLTFIKPHYSITIYFSMLTILFYKIGIKSELSISLNIVVFCLVILISMHYIDSIFEYSQIMPKHFSSDGGTTRKNEFWHNEYDFFTFMPIGLPMAFSGPTLVEAINNVKLFPFFFEGTFLFILLVYYNLTSIIVRKKVNTLALSLFFSFTCMILITHYPFGLFNAGSAMRYRSGFILPMCVFLIYMKQYVTQGSAKN